MSTFTLGEIFLVNGQRVELPASTGAMLGFQRAPDITATPFAAPSGPTLNLRRAPTSSGPVTPECQRYNALVAAGDLKGAVAAAAACNASKSTGAVADGCAGLRARVAQYGSADPQPVIRQALLAKCEAYQRAQASGIRSGVEPTGYPEPPPEGMDPKVKIAIGAGAALALGFVAWKVLG